MNWNRITTQLDSSASLLSRSLRALSSRCTTSWSVPWVAVVRKQPPNSPAQKLNVCEKKSGPRAKWKIWNLLLYRGHRNDLIPSARHQREDHHEAEQRAADIERHLRNVGPDDSRHPTVECVEQRQQRDDHDRRDLAGAEHDRDHQRDGEHPHAFRQRARDQKGHRREAPDASRRSAAASARRPCTSARGSTAG